jgi:hypothetical protein
LQRFNGTGRAFFGNLTRAAELYLKDIELKRVRGELLGIREVKRILFKDLTDKYSEWAKDRKSKRRILDESYVVARLKARFTDLASKVTRGDVEAYLSERLKTVGPARHNLDLLEPPNAFGRIPPAVAPLDPFREDRPDHLEDLRISKTRSVIGTSRRSPFLLLSTRIMRFARSAFSQRRASNSPRLRPESRAISTICRRRGEQASRRAFRSSTVRNRTRPGGFLDDDEVRTPLARPSTGGDFGPRKHVTKNKTRPGKPKAGLAEW